jgi:hypothetical protein
MHGPLNVKFELLKVDWNWEEGIVGRFHPFIGHKGPWGE